MPLALLHQLEILFAIAVALSFFSFGKKILYPFQIFTTWVHECSHALTAALLGGSSIRITLSADGSGLTHFKIPQGRLRHAIIASSGYVGASLMGCLLFIASVDGERFRFELTPHALILALCACLTLTLVFWIRNAFGWFSVLLLTTAFTALAYSPYAHHSKTVLIFLGMQTALNAFFDIRILFSLGKRRGGVASDAHTLQKLFFLPYWFWALMWMGMSLGFMVLTIKLI
jgi:hypothetical protein